MADTTAQIEKAEEDNLLLSAAAVGSQKAESSQSSEESSDLPSLRKEKVTKPKRTTGLKLFDVFLYPILTNVAVFALSVGATYFSMHGKEAGKLIEDKDGKMVPNATRKFGLFMSGRVEWLGRQFNKVGITGEKTVEAASMVTFSFVDGSIMAPFIKMLEDRREKIAKWIDTKLGTKPKDESVYEAEPKQSWASVLGGRAVTAGIVVPTAYLLGNFGRKENGKIGRVTEKEKSFNDLMFKDPGYNFGEKLGKKYPAQNAWIAEKLPGTNIAGLAKVGLFEAFYTSVCTAGLYVSSRFFARKGEERRDRKEAINKATHEILEKPNADTKNSERSDIQESHTQEREPLQSKSFASRENAPSASHLAREASREKSPAYIG